ncbi:hypothetical protein HG536_0C02250 [Torulaspora globosa]|uniref:Conserved oligomeric Golgi complex subunit 2 C-terminal domain-containing protein n=1 Tax=Torulaspora globosa TaxID=48254 RepID=A0A7G3ZEX0_9SACH|nr:uncharacterized protein HG536_0C02250 [Torulaspora globosa]QLL32056.1 hypothetical protein HG536_0C02250 [Torulaspora globosa]
MHLSDEDELNLELPRITEVNRDLFSSEVEKLDDDIEAFDVDEFLLRNNCNFMPLDFLIGDLSKLSQDMVEVLLEKVTTKYNDYLDFCEPYMNEKNQNVVELQETMADLKGFRMRLEQLSCRDLARTQEVISDAVDYLRKLDEMSRQLQSHLQIPEMIYLAGQISKSLHAMCGTEPLEQQLCTELTTQLGSLIHKIRSQLEELSALDSSYVHHLRNEYHGLLQGAQISLKILTDKCLEDVHNYEPLARTLLSLLSAKPLDEPNPSDST